MINLEKIKEVKFNYYDENQYIYNFEMLKDRISKISENEYRFYLICKNTNVSANGEIFLNLKIEDDTLTFRTDYFANSFEYIKLKKNLEKSNQTNEFFTVDFGKDLFELEILY